MLFTVPTSISKPNTDCHSVYNSSIEPPQSAMRMDLTSARKWINQLEDRADKANYDEDLVDDSQLSLVFKQYAPWSICPFTAPPPSQEFLVDDDSEDDESIFIGTSFNHSDDEDQEDEPMRDEVEPVSFSSPKKTRPQKEEERSELYPITSRF
ncbi:hypothetical protein GEMRC1_007663 [Eukaryota sp. GEM-RC1]